jgi:hypothetical protein
MTPKPIDVFIEKHKHLFWYTPEDKKAGISDEMLMENVINYCDLNTIKELFAIWGLQKSKRVFEGMKGRKAHNFYPEIYHFFSEYFKRVA